VRELATLMTAIMVAGRSGSAFAAQIGSMKLNEEIDAMRTIGVSPMEALVFPRVLATVLTMPLLGFYAALISIFGGGVFVWFSLDIPPVTFVQRIQKQIRHERIVQAAVKLGTTLLIRLDDARERPHGGLHARAHEARAGDRTARPRRGARPLTTAASRCSDARGRRAR
jgi:hypothetical protein